MDLPGLHQLLIRPSELAIALRYHHSQRELVGLFRIAEVQCHQMRPQWWQTLY